MVSKSNKTLPKKNKRFNVRVINFLCGDCDILMKRWNDPYEQLDEHFWMKCPKCGMHIRIYEQTFHCIDENGRPYLETRWNRDLEWKKDFLQKEKNYWENRKRQQEEMAELQKQFDESITPEQIEKIKEMKPING